MNGKITIHLKRQYDEKVLKFILFLFRSASFTLIFNFLLYQNIEEFLLTKEFLNIIRIFIILFVQVKESEWSGVLKKKMENFENVLKRVLE